MVAESAVTLPTTPRTEAEKALFGDVVEPGYTFDHENAEANLGETLFERNQGPQDKMVAKLRQHGSETAGDEAEWVTMWHPDGSTSQVPRGQVANYVRKKNFLLRPPTGVVPAQSTIHCRYCRKMLRTVADRDAHEEAFHPSQHAQAEKERARERENEQTELYRQLVSQGDAMKALLEQNQKMADELAALKAAREGLTMTEPLPQPRRGRPPGS